MQEIERLKKRVNTAKTTIILVAVLTIANIVLILIESDMVFTFAAFIPQLVITIFAGIAADQGVNSLIIYIGIAIAILMALIYVALWLGAKKKDSFIIAALVFFGLDTAVLLYGLLLSFDTSYIIDVVFHAWVIYDLILGVSAYSKLKKMPVEERIMQQNSEQADYYNPYPQGNEENQVFDTPSEK